MIDPGWVHTMIKDTYMTIREMCKEELAFAAECTAGEGWVSENRATLEGFYQRDPGGCLVAEDHGSLIGICIATRYGRSGFIGELIVHPQARGRGLGEQLLSQGVQYLQRNGIKTIYLDGVLKAVSLYERNGFRKVCRSWRFSGQLLGRFSPRVRRMTLGDLKQVNALDQDAFGDDRSFFIRHRLGAYPGLSYVLMEGDKLRGFILGRAGEGWVSAGPWVVNDDEQHPEELLYAIAGEAAGRVISLGILNINRAACDLVRSLGFNASEDSPWRMALGNSCDLGALPGCYAIGSAAKG